MFETWKGGDGFQSFRVHHIVDLDGPQSFVAPEEVEVSAMDDFRNPVAIAEDMFRQAVKRKKTTGGGANRGKGRAGRGARNGGGGSYQRAK